MVVQVVFDGMKEATSSKGNHYADLFVRGMNVDGDADVEQLHLRTFSETVIAQAKTLGKGDVAHVDVKFDDAFVREVIK